VNGGRNYDQTVVVPRTKSGYLLGHPWILRYRFAVTKRQVRTISRKDFERSKNPQRLYAGRQTELTMRQSELHGDMQSGYSIPPFIDLMRRNK
jgi:hypothetical protein